MTTYGLSWEPLSLVARSPQSETPSHHAKTPASPTSEYFDITAAWYNHPQPYTAQPLSPGSASSRHKVPELTHRYSADSAHSVVEGVSTHCSSCGLAFSPAALVAEDKFSHLCADIAREHECPDTHRPSPAERRASLSRRWSAHHQRRHSSLHEPLASQGTAPHSEPLQQHHEPGQQQEPGSQERESNPLAEEADSTEQASSSPLELDSRPLTQQPHHLHDKGTDFYAHTLTSLAIPLEQGPHPQKQEPHHIHDKGTDFYAHTLTSLVTPTENEHEQSPTLQSIQSKPEDIHALNEASPTDDPYYQTPAARLSLEHERQEDWKRHCRAQRAQRQLRFGTAWVSPAQISDLYADEMEEERTRHGRFCGELGAGFMREQYDARCL